MLKVDFYNVFKEDDILKHKEDVKKCHNLLHEKKGLGNDFLGWLDWPNTYDKAEFDRILKLKQDLKGKYNVLLVCGIGGSYLGARAALEMINGLYPDNEIETIFIGNTFSSTYLSQVLKYIQDKEVVLNVISKSGTTTETAISFRIFEQFMWSKYSSEACSRILVTTDKNKGTLLELAKSKNYRTFTVPDDIGGRYSVFTSVGLLPLALSGIDIEEIMKGSKKAFIDFNNENIEENDCYKYALARRILESKGYESEILVTYHPQLSMVSEWWKQLFGESEGKDGKGIIPNSATFSTDLHSIGQFIQEGLKKQYETVLWINNMPQDIIFPKDDQNLDLMGYLEGKSINWTNEMAMKGTLSAHVEEGKVPNIVVNLKDNSAFSFGYMIYFFFKACAVSCYLLGVNPFNQPGVEVYKKKMFKLLGKN